jgi:hypothetical protein
MHLTGSGTTAATSKEGTLNEIPSIDVAFDLSVEQIEPQAPLHSCSWAFSDFLLPPWQLGCAGWQLAAPFASHAFMHANAAAEARLPWRRRIATLAKAKSSRKRRCIRNYDNTGKGPTGSGSEGAWDAG